MVSLKAALSHYGALLSLCGGIAASPISPNYAAELSNLQQRDPLDFYLRIMPLGASITKGFPIPANTHGNGYRKAIRDQLRFEGYEVNMVGSQPHGEMADSDTEGYPGYRIDQIHPLAVSAVQKYKPNVILLNAGTNNAVQDNGVNEVSDLMGKMISECLEHVPDTLLVLSTLVPNKLPNGIKNVPIINEQLRALVPKFQAEGKKVILADMNDGFILDEDISDQIDGKDDKTHPTAEGFRKMASVWRHAIAEGQEKGWIKAPSDDVDFKDDEASNQCSKQYGDGNSDPRGETQVLWGSSSLIKDDGWYRHSSESKGKIGAATRKHWFAQLVNHGAARGKELDDWITIEDDATSLVLYVNNPDKPGTFSNDGIKLDVKDKCNARGVRWGDVNNDGLDDFICIGTEGNMYVSINKGGEKPTFEYLGLYKEHVDGYAQENVRLGDIDGDGRLDYCVVASNGNIDCWRNGGVGDKAEYWQNMGVDQPVFTGKGKGDIAGVRFVDINGDGRADWLWVDNDGSVSTWANQRGFSKSMRPYWKKSGDPNDENDEGITHVGMGKDVGRDKISFGRIYGNGRADYMFWDTSDEKDQFVSAWKNTGSGGTHQKGDGAHWGDMTGTGNDDYLWIYAAGDIVLFRNNNKPPSTDKFDDATAWAEMGIVLSTGMNRKALHIGDWDGDGKADVIGVDEKTGALTIWFTDYNADEKKISFRKETREGTYCTQGWGVGLFDIGAFFADITGNGKVDYLCMDPTGLTKGWLNRDDKELDDVGQIKFSEKLDRANFRFADVNGDKKADLLWVDKFTGDATVWYNNGELPDGGEMNGSKFHWVNSGKLYQGSSRGPNMHYPNLGGQGRADMVEVDPQTAKGKCWFNSCPRGGDDGEIVDPKLPTYSP